MTTEMNFRALPAALAVKEQLVSWRRTIHQFPELGFDVQRTASFVTEALAGMGIPWRANVGKTGVVAFLGAQSGPTVAIRADMDALPIQEENDVPYVSQVPGCMHACGHDAHVAMLLGVAELLRVRQLPGRVRLLFQPSEERSDEENQSGAQRMIADGAMEGVDVVLAQHVDGTLDTGQIRMREGYAWAAVDSFSAKILGRGGHGAYPHQTVDPIWLSSIVLNALYAIPSRLVNPLQPNVVTVGVINGGTASNVIPDTVAMRGTLRSYDPAVREQLIEDVRNAFSLTRSMGGDYELEMRPGYPAAYNDPRVSTCIRQVADDVLGPGRADNDQSTMGGEDFAYLAQLAPGAMFRLGVKRPGGPARHLHAATFDVDEDALPLGTAILAQTALCYLAGVCG